MASSSRELKSLPPSAHWLCPISDSTSDTDGHLEPNNVEYRQQLVSDCLQILGYDGEDVLVPQRELVEHINRQLTRCDQCITEYYKVKCRLIDRLRHEYDEEEVDLLVGLFDQQDFRRIQRGLDDATRTLLAMDAARRKTNALDDSSQFALFEALNCDAFLRNSDLVRKYLDQPMALVQTKRMLQLVRYCPAATYFLFDAEPSRCDWATQTWNRYRNQLSKADFDFAVRDPLAKQMQKIKETITDAAEIQRFWCGMRLIVKKLDKDLIAHSLLALDIDVCRLALDHLQVATPALRSLLQTVQALLEIAPQTFWDSMATINPTTVIEQIFNNRQYDQYMIEAQATDDYTTSPLNDLLGWAEVFMTSLQPPQQVQACRSFTFQLLKRLQEPSFAFYARSACKQTGLLVLHQTLASCNKSETWLNHVGRMVAVECLEITSQHIQRIMDCLTLPPTDPFGTRSVQKALEILELALALECRTIKADQEALKTRKELPAGFECYQPSMWDAVLRKLANANTTLATAALVKTKDLAEIEEIKVNADDDLRQEKERFNAGLKRVVRTAQQLLERVAEFGPADLETIFHQPEAVTALTASLFSPDADMREASIDLMKTMSCEASRREAIGYILRKHFGLALNDISFAIRRVSSSKNHASYPPILKVAGDVLQILCNSQNGLLRTRTLIDGAELRATVHFWQHLWGALRIIYQMTEQWSRLPHDKQKMEEFCRDTMQLSDQLFDQYGVFASALNTVKRNKSENRHESSADMVRDAELLDYATITMEHLVRWLRFRDIYLASTSASLTRKILHRLSDAHVSLNERTTKFVEDVVSGGSRARTHLTDQEKAGIARALENHIDRPIILASKEIEKSGSLNAATSTASSEPRGAGAVAKQKGAIDFDKWQSKVQEKAIPVDSDEDKLPVELKGLQAYKASALANDNRKPQAVSQTTQQAVRFGKGAIRQDASQAASFKEKREKERQAKKKRDAEMIAKSRGIGKDGTSLQGLGVEGKDHAPSGPSMMVSSSESDSEDDKLGEEVFGSLPKASDAVREYQLSRLQAIRQQGPVKKARQVRSAKDMRARLAPNLTNLHQTILGWDYFHTGDFPPGTGRQDYRQVPNRFRTPVEYQQVFEPLLILEAWNGFLKSREDNTKPFTVKIANRMNVDAFVEISTSMPMTEGTDFGLAEADIVLLSKSQSPTIDATEPHCLARVHRIIRKRGAMEISYRVTHPGHNASNFLAPNTMVSGVRVLSVTPLEREYGALLGLQYFDLCDEVVQARPSPILQYTDQQLQSWVAKYTVNKAQAKAIRSALDNDAFTLIQGPPGSGKTKTIVAIAGALLTDILKDKGVPINRPRGADAVSRPSAIKKLLVCAPSNAAVDELVMRFRQGVKTVHGEDRKVSVVRLGRSDAINTKVQDITLEELVNARLKVTPGEKTSKTDDINELIENHKTTHDELNALRSQMDEINAQGRKVTPEQDRQFEILKRRKQQLSNNIDTARDKGNSATRDADINRRRVQQQILDESDIICATLSGSGHDMFQNLNIEFETVIIDEAAQSIELSALIPLKYGCSKCILVGDPKQLPPTVLSREAARFQYEQSLFVRMQRNHPRDVHLLDTQYRMHPEISSFPSSIFYEGRLLDGPDMGKLRRKPWHKSDLLGPYRFFDVQGMQQRAPKGHSLINLAEIEVALQLYQRLLTDCKGYDFGNRIGIITPYKSQLKELRARFADVCGTSVLTDVEFNTTDAFQGRESEIIIFSCVRASTGKSIGFLDDVRRMNVGITRAKCSLWVLGNSQSLMNGEFWAKLIQDAKSRNRFSGGNVLEMLKQPGPRLLDDSHRASFGNVQDAEAMDVEMRDAPADGASSLISSRRSSFARPDVAPAGGANGLNVLANCQKCGSAAHMTHRCNNPIASAMVNPKCQRCGATDHAKDKCTVERCLECGDFGHTTRLCTSKRFLSKGEKARVANEEAKHRRFLTNTPAFKAQKQLGDHDKNVPIVQTTKTHDGQTRENVPPRGQSRKPGGRALPADLQRRLSLHESPGKSVPTYQTSKPDPREISNGTGSAAVYPDMTPKSPPVQKKLGVNRPPLPGNGNRVMKRRKEADPLLRPKDKRVKR